MGAKNSRKIFERLLESFFAIGVDIENIPRFTGLDRRKNKFFLDKIFTRKELDYCFAKKNYPAHLAARFVAKEAVYKALGSLGIKKPLNKIEIVNKNNGVPTVTIAKNIKIILSLSHCTDKAIAFAVAIKL